MAITRSMSKKQKHDASTNGGSAPWSSLTDDVLLLVMMQLGIIDFLAFGGVCKSWRSLALSNRNMFMASRQPMCISVLNHDAKDCYLVDIERRRFKTVLPNATGRTLVGLTCGYLILYERRTKDFWLVNPITRHELHFPVFPFYIGFNPALTKATLVFSPSISGWVLVILLRYSGQISFSVAGEQAHWKHVSFDFDILDLHAFKGYIYTINTDYSLCKLRLYPEPTFTLHKIKNFPELDHPLPLPLEFVSSRENLFLIGRISKHLFIYHELNVDESDLVLMEDTIRQYSVFVSNLQNGCAVNPEVFWADPKFEKTLCIHEDWSFGSMWYFPHDCFNVNLLEE